MIDLAMSGTSNFFEIKLSESGLMPLTGSSCLTIAACPFAG